MISGIVSAFLSGMFLYEGGKLFFWFYDRRGGVIVLAAGCAVFILFIWSMIRFFGTGLAKRIGTPPQIKKYDNGNKFLYNILCFPEKSTFPRRNSCRQKAKNLFEKLSLEKKRPECILSI